MLFSRFIELKEEDIRRDLSQWEVKGLVFELMDGFIQYSKQGGKVRTKIDYICESYTYAEFAEEAGTMSLLFWNTENGLLNACDVELVDVPVNRNGKTTYETMYLHGMTLSKWNDVICEFRPKFSDDSFDMGGSFEYFALEL